MPTYTLPIDLQPQQIGQPANGVNLYQVPNASMKVLEAIINTTWTEAQTARTDYAAKMTALNGTGGLLNGVALPGDIAANVVTLTAPTAPTITLADAPASTVYSDFAAEYVPLANWLKTKFSDFQTTYFPNDVATYSAAESWVQGALANPNAALPLAVQSQILADDQARIVTETSRAKDSLMATFAARRFPMPSGAAVSAALQLDQSAQDKMAESSRKIAIMSVEQMKFALDKAIALRTNAMSETLEFIKTMTFAPQTSSQLVGIGQDTQSKRISAVGSYYNSLISAAELTNKVAEFNVTAKLEADTKNQMVDVSMVSEKVKTMVAEAQQISQLIAALVNNLHASVSLQAGGSTITTQAQSDIP